MMRSSDWPRASERGWPKIRSAPGFQKRMMPRRSATTIASARLLSKDGARKSSRSFMALACVSEAVLDRLFEWLVFHLLAEIDRMGHDLLQLLRIEFAFPAADDDRGDAIPDKIGQRPAFTHELVDADQDRKRLDRDVWNDRQRG